MSLLRSLLVPITQWRGEERHVRVKLERAAFARGFPTVFFGAKS